MVWVASFDQFLRMTNGLKEIVSLQFDVVEPSPQFESDALSQESWGEDAMS